MLLLRYICNMQKYRTIISYKSYFEDFVSQQRPKVIKKIFQTLRIIEQIERIPSTYLKYIEGTDGLFEIRIMFGSDIFRIFCFFDEGKLIVLLSGFQKKTQKTPSEEIKRAERLKNEYFNEKKFGGSRMKNIKTLSELEDKYIGKKGTPERTAYEKELADLMIGYQVKNARIKLDLTQEELAERIHKKRSFISRVENDGSNLTIKTLREIVEKGLGGKLNIELNI